MQYITKQQYGSPDRNWLNPDRLAWKMAYPGWFARIERMSENTQAPKEGLWRAEQIGSGTFLIRKPKRKSTKLRQSRLKGTVRGARK
jgi:hypothetical protein